MKISIEEGGCSADFESGADDRILYAGLAARLALPYECATGTCGQCRATLRTGEVKDLWPDAPGKAYLKRDRGEVLLCQTAAVSPCSIIVPQKNGADFQAIFAPRKLSGVLVAKERLTTDVIRIGVRLQTELNFEPGQFVLLSGGGLTAPRAYSIANAGPANELDFLIKLKSGGLFTNWIFHEASIGSHLALFGPLGRATYRPSSDSDMLLAAGGTGLSAIISALDVARRCGANTKHKIHVFFGVRTPEDAFYLETLSAHAASAPENVEVNVCFSDLPKDWSPRSVNGLRLSQGFVHEVVEAAASRIATPTVTALFAGPPPMIEALVRVLVLKVKVPPKRIRFDKFS